MNPRHYLKYALTQSPASAAAKGARLLARRVRAAIIGWARRKTCAYLAASSDAVASPPVRLRDIDWSKLEPVAEKIAKIAAAAVTHEFDLLGSGPVRVCIGGGYPGFEGNRYDNAAAADVSPGNRHRSTSIRALIGDGYSAIDWHVDFRSGYHWPADRPAGAMAYGHAAGVDIKVPWELARLQHLPTLATAHRLADDKAPGFEQAAVYAAAFRNQVLDFLAGNPPGYGINWASPMDVAIRAANMVIGHWLFAAQGVTFDPAFRGELAAGLTAHGRAVAANLDWNDGCRGNHYLCEIAGLAFIAAGLGRNPETDGWLSLAARQLPLEIDHQFFADGANFEASTAYHRLSAEAATYAVALILGLEDASRPLPDELPTRLATMARFTQSVTKPNGCVIQIGDVDNGRFFKICPVDTNNLDHRGLVAAVNGLVATEDFTAFAGPSFAFETEMIAALSGSPAFTAAPPPPKLLIAESADGSADQTDEIAILLPDADILVGLERRAYPDFGLYIWRSVRFFLSVRCGAFAADGTGAHAHNDQLALELNIDGEDWLADPGSYVYTALPELRDLYRSRLAHATPKFGDGEPSPLNRGLFRLADRCHGRCLRFDDKTFLGVHTGFSKPVFRRVRFDDGRIIIQDSYGGPPPDIAAADDIETVTSAAELRRRLGSDVPFAAGYGERGSD